MKKINILLESIHVKDTYIGGWYDGKRTYIGIYDKGRCYGTLSSHKLHTLARNIIKEFEGKK